MKPVLLLIVLLLSFFTKAQHPYIPIPKDSVLWVIVRENWHEGEPNYPPHSFKYWVSWFEGKDTLFNGKLYSCYFRDGNVNMPPAIGTVPKHGGEWIREDTIAKKVWYLRTKGLTAKEEILYDFSLQAGDTLNDTLLYYFDPNRLFPFKAWVDLVDSVFWADGKWHYRWFINSNYGPAWGSAPAQAVQIEGMGYTTGFLEDPLLRYHPLVNTTEEVTCFRVKDQWLYHVPNLWNADCDTLISRNILAPNSVPGVVNELEQPMLYPNPVRQGQALHLNRFAGSQHETYNIQGWDITGRQTISIQLKPGERIETGSLDLKSGIYLFRITDKQGRIIYQQKVMVI